MRCALGALLLLAPLGLAAQGWPQDPASQQRLTAGEVIVQAVSIDPSHPRGTVRAAVLIHASPDAIWRIVTDCREAGAFVPGLRSCRRVDAAADGSWEDIEQEVRYSWLLPTVRYVFRAQYDRPRRIDFHRVSGDLRAEEGAWLLSEAPGGSGTLVEYEMYLDPGFWVPQILVQRTLRTDLPEALSALKNRLEGPQAAIPRAANPE
jgi:Polyketide cyclase / dehydrase and lipid transport